MAEAVKILRRRTLRTSALACMIAALLIGTAQSGSVVAQHSAVQMNLPPLAIVAPTNGATVIGTVIVVFQTSADLSKMTMGSHSHAKGSPHLHIDLDKRITMPSLKQLTKVGADQYQSNLGRVKRGRHTIRVYWGDDHHKPVGPVQTVVIMVK